MLETRDVSNFQDDGLVCDAAIMLYQIETKFTTGIHNLTGEIPAFMEGSETFPLLQPRKAQRQQRSQISQCPRRYSVDPTDGLIALLNANSMDGCASTCIENDFAKKGGLLVVALHQMNPSRTELLQDNAGYEAGKAGAATNIDPPKRFLIKLDDPQTVGDMSFADIR